MASTHAFLNVRDHGILVDQKRRRVKCNHCSKEMSDFTRLKYHLGHVGTDVVSCPAVPEDVKNSFRNLLLQRKTTCRGRKVGVLFHDYLQLKRKISHDSSVLRRDKHGGNQTASSQNKEHIEMDYLIRNADYLIRNAVPEHLLDSSCKAGKQTSADGKFQGKISSREIQRYIARFFYETGIDFGVAKSPSFRRMFAAVHGNSQLKIPTSCELEGILEDELKKVQEYVAKVRHSWASTGCSVLLDGWIDERGRTLVNFVVECPDGPIFLRSADVSLIVDDADALQLLVEEVIEEVGTNNVFQIVACSSTGWMGAVGKQFSNRHRTVFWNLSVSHCIDLIFKNIGKMDSIKCLLDKAKVITRFIYRHSKVLELMRSHIHGHDLVKCSSLKSVAIFLTFENIVVEKKNLMTMVSSLEWTTLTDSGMDGERVANMIRDVSFWTEAEIAMKGTAPLLRVVDLILKASGPQMGYIYETMNQVKDTIKEEFENKKSQYEPVWKMIDEIWDGYLHSPLHAAGYYLNPTLFYSTDFYNDSEVAFGILSCIVRLVQNQRTQDKIVSQLDDYRHARGGFEDGSAIQKSTKVSPAQWWSTYGKDYPELQNFAIRILSQTCDGASKYALERDFAKKLPTQGMIVEQKSLIELTALRYNLNLRDRHFGLVSEQLLDQTDLMNDWICESIAVEDQSSSRSEIEVHYSRGSKMHFG